MRTALVITLAIFVFSVPTPSKAAGWQARSTKPRSGSRVARAARVVIGGLQLGEQSTPELLRAVGDRLARNRRRFRGPRSDLKADRFFHALQRQQRRSAPLLFNDADGDFRCEQRTYIALAHGEVAGQPWRVIIAPKGIFGVKPHLRVQKSATVPARHHFESNLPGLLLDPVGTLLLGNVGWASVSPAKTVWRDVRLNDPLVASIDAEKIAAALDREIDAATSRDPISFTVHWAD